jgi:hypothetical protein
VRFTDDVSPEFAIEPISTLQFFQPKISFKETAGLTWPLCVYGFIAARDLVDYKRNIIFERTRDDCQLICEEVGVFCLLAAPFVCTYSIFGLVFS